MYKLYYRAGTCALGVHALMHELNQEFELIDSTKVDNFEQINPAGQVPVLDDDGEIVVEGGAIMQVLMERHGKEMLPEAGKERVRALEALALANASLHPAYSKMFMCKRIEDTDASEKALEVAAKGLQKTWDIVEARLGNSRYLSGDFLSGADFFITTYANWNHFFKTPIKLGNNTKRVLKEVSALPSFQKALQEEGVKYTVEL